MINLLSIIVIGFVLGMRHATDPDHVIAVTTIVSRQRNAKRAALIGVCWGLGHTVTIFAVGTAIILFNLVVPARLGLGMELAVGLMLIVLGVWNLAGFLHAVPQANLPLSERPLTHSHPHSHGEFIHSHPHSHEPEAHPHSPDQTPLAKLDRTFGKAGLYQLLRPLVIGIVHGLAGSAAVALLVLTTIRDPRWAVAYLLVFGTGTVAGMMVITMSLASAFKFFGRRHDQFSHRLGLASGLVSLAFGIRVAYQIGFANGLFTSHPHWVPR